jgi:hypothetical protein
MKDILLKASGTRLRCGVIMLRSAGCSRPGLIVEPTGKSMLLYGKGWQQIFSEDSF